MSFFRSPREDASDSYADENPLSTDYGENGQTGPHPFYSLGRVETLDSDRAPSEIPNNLALTLVQDPRRRQDLFAHSLLEDRCMLEALTELQKTGQAYDKDHPEVKALANQKYHFLCNWLRRNDMIASGPERAEFGQIRHAIRQGVDYLVNQTPTLESPPLFPRRGSPIALTVRRGVNAVPSPGTADIDQMFRNLSLSNSLPEFMQLLFEHPMLDSSRYRKSFVEIGVLGKGGYGKVYHVRNILDRSEYAVKKVALNSSRIERIKQRGQAELDALLAEVVTLARLDHPNIVRYYSGWLEYHTPEFLSAASQLTSSRRLKLLEGPTVGKRSSATNGLSGYFHHSRQTNTDDHLLNGGSQIIFESSAPASRVEKLYSSRHNQSHISGQSSSRLSLQSPPFPAVTPLKNGAGGNRVNDTDIHDKPATSEHEDSEAVGGRISSVWTSSDSSIDPSEPRLTLHVQMALYPLSLADYLMEPSNRGPAELVCNLRHCFHLDMSLRILLEILDGVEYLHKMGIVHRDLKPSNIFLSIQDRISHKHLDLGACTDCKRHNVPSSGPYLNLRIGDFGLVAEIACPKSYNSPSVAEAVGTEMYRPPGPEAIHEKLDVYAMGVIAFELLSPFETSMSLPSQMVSGPADNVTGMERYDMLQLLRKGIPPESFLSNYGQDGKEITKMVKSMVDSEPQKRPACSEIRASVRNIIG